MWELQPAAKRVCPTSWLRWRLISSDDVDCGNQEAGNPLLQIHQSDNDLKLHLVHKFQKKNPPLIDHDRWTDWCYVTTNTAALQNTQSWVNVEIPVSGSDQSFADRSQRVPQEKAEAIHRSTLGVLDFYWQDFHGFEHFENSLIKPTRDRTQNQSVVKVVREKKGRGQDQTDHDIFSWRLS